ncbi:MAG: DinB family protein [Thermomicrobiales bacterium]
MTPFASPEIALHWHHIELAMDRILVANADRSVDERNFRPPAPDTNSIHVLAVHTIGNLRQNVFEAILGKPTGRDRDAEFTALASATNDQSVIWPDIKDEVRAALMTIPDTELDSLKHHPRRGERSIRDILLMASTHAAEHAGHAELTRDLALEAVARSNESELNT